ncbi:MAG: MoaD/ThiS family protein [Chloroflexi bacterium]|nr:MoaD/ThiS family protein [Chloroflexota bacterium]
MARVIIPSLMRDLTGGQAEVEAEGRTLAELVHNLDARYPGVAGRLLVGGQLDPALIAIVDGRPASLGLRARVERDSEVRFVPAVGGG